MELLLAMTPLLVIVLCIIFVRPVLTIFAILTGDKETLKDAGSLCSQPIPLKDQYWTREEMGLEPTEQEWKQFRARKWRQRKDGSWFMLPPEDKTPPNTHTT